MSQYHAPSQTADQLPEDVQRLVDFEGAPNAYFNQLASLAARTCGASAVAVVRVNPDARGADVIAIWPEAATAAAWADRAAEAAIELHTGDSEWFQRDLNLDTAKGPMRATVVAAPQSDDLQVRLQKPRQEHATHLIEPSLRIPLACCGI